MSVVRLLAAGVFGGSLSGVLLHIAYTEYAAHPDFSPLGFGISAVIWILTSVVMFYWVFTDEEGHMGMAGFTAMGGIVFTDLLGAAWSFGHIMRAPVYCLALVFLALLCDIGGQDASEITIRKTRD